MTGKSSLPGLYDIPVNLIMGFLGVGKTTAILHLLTEKSTGERWAVLVNEFGAVGIDGAIYASKGTFVREVPGGCMCCATGVPMQVAVNRLLCEARPDRLLIEPSGLGHPRRVLDTLACEHFGEVLDIRASVCLVDPRKFKDSRYTSHENFVDQIALADVLIANKVDLADNCSLQLFGRWAGQCDPPKRVIGQTIKGRLDRSWLDLPRDPSRKPRFSHRHVHAPGSQNPDGFVSSGSRGRNQGDGFQSRGWVFPKEVVFDHSRLYAWIVGQAPERLKGVVSTDKGWFLFNCSDGLLTVTGNLPCPDSRMEIFVSEGDWNAIETGLQGCLIV